MPHYYYTQFDAPFGKTVYLAGSERGISSLTFHNEENEFYVWFKKKFDLKPTRQDEFFSSQLAKLRLYFTGELRHFNITLDLVGTTFQKQVWKMLREIPFGETVNYGMLAKRIGGPQFSRAVGLANSKNPVSIIVPCHRVIGSNGNLTGYAGGLDVKQWLLTHERHALMP